MESGSDGLDGGGNESRLAAHIAAVNRGAVEEAAKLNVGLVVAEGEGAEEVEHSLRMGESEAHLASGVDIYEVVRCERIDALTGDGIRRGFPASRKF